MSLNFTGSTGRRNVNLGNRSLIGKNKSMFLKTAQLERQKREAERLKNNSAKTIQAACRRYLDLLNWRKSLAANWDGHSIVKFQYFFPYLIKIQDANQSISQLKLVDANLQQYSPEELIKLENILSESFILLSEQPEVYEELLKDILQLLDDIPLGQNKSAFFDQKFTQSLIVFYLNGEKYALKYILKFAARSSLRLLIVLFVDNDLIKDSISNNLIDDFINFEVQLLQSLSENPDVIKSLSNIEKLSLLSEVSSSMFKFPQFLSNDLSISLETILTVITLLLNSISVKIVIADDTMTDAHTLLPSIYVPQISFANFKIQISTSVYESIQPLFQFNNFKCFHDKNLRAELIAYLSALLHFVSIVDSEQANSLKSNIDLNWVLKEDNKDLILSCFDMVSSFHLYKQYILSDKIPSQNLAFVMFKDDYKVWWDALIVLQEFLSNVLFLTSDENFSKAILISPADLCDFAKFLKYFVSDILLRYRDIAKPDNYNSLRFTRLFKKLLSLTHMLYMKDIKLQLFGKDFWILANNELELGLIASAIPTIEKIHNDSIYEDAIKFEDQSYSQNDIDFLQSSKLASLFKSNIPKKVIDIFYILTYAPFMIPFSKRAEIFHLFIEFDRRNNNVNEWFPTKVEGTIARNNMLFDSFKAFGNLTGKEFKGQFSVQFVNEFGEKEAGIDGGGLTKELLTTLVSSAFIPSEENRKNNKGLQFFKQGEDYKLYCNPEFFFKMQYEKIHKNEIIPYACTNEEYLKMSRFLGMVLGKCLYDNVLLDISFTSFFLNTCATLGSKFFRNLIGDKVSVAGRTNSFDELKNLDSSLYKSLSYILLQTDEDKFSNMGLNFSINDIFYDEDGDVYHVEVPLLPQRKTSPDSDSYEPISVTSTNKMQFVRLLTTFKLSKQSNLFMKYFVDGLFQVIKPYWLLLFNPFELQTLISGDDDLIDIEDLKQNVEYGGYLDTDETIIYLFQILHEFNKDDRAKFIKFVTSSPKQPLLGFKELYPKFGIRNSGSDTSRLPTASTCVNLLKLPDYRDKELLRQKLLYSINSKAGFDLS